MILGAPHLDRCSSEKKEKKKKKDNVDCQEDKYKQYGPNRREIAIV